MPHAVYYDSCLRLDWTARFCILMTVADCSKPTPEEVKQNSKSAAEEAEAALKTAQATIRQLQRAAAGHDADLHRRVQSISHDMHRQEIVHGNASHIVLKCMDFFQRIS